MIQYTVNQSIDNLKSKSAMAGATVMRGRYFAEAASIGHRALSSRQSSRQ